MASTSRESLKHTEVSGSTQVKITILASEWGSSKGELSTINRELAIQLAKSSSVEITFFVPQCSDEDKEEALCHNVHILKATPLTGYGELEWLSFPPKDLEIHIIVGHGVKLGRQAQVIRNSHKCKWVQVVHTDPEELGMFKSYPNPISAGEKKRGEEVELCNLADFVVGIGPKLTEAFRSYLRWCRREETIFDFTPGLFDEFMSIEQVPEERKHPTVLVFGRGDTEDFELKGFDIAARAVASLPDTHFLFFGAPDGKLEEVAQRFLDCDVPASRLKVRSYNKSREGLKRLFCEVDLVLMPSRTEGFGLAGLEALSAGLPVLVCQNSGFGEAVSKVPFGSSCVINSEDSDRWATAIKKAWEKGRQSRLEEAEILRSSYERKYSWSEQSDALLFKMINLVRGKAEEELHSLQTELRDVREATEQLTREFQNFKQNVERQLDELKGLIRGAEGGHHGRRCSGSLQILGRKLSLTKSSDYEPLAGEDPDESQESVEIEKHSMNQTHKEGSRVELKCEVKHNKNVTFQWLFDGTKIQGQVNSTLVLDSVKLRDFGWYKCEVKTTNGRPCQVESRPVALDVTPRDGMKLKLLTDVFKDSFDVQEKVQKLLSKNIDGVGGCKRIAAKYKMDVSELDGGNSAGESVLSYLGARLPNLTAYDFCKTLKEPKIGRLDIVKELLDHLSLPQEQTA